MTLSLRQVSPAGHIQLIAGLSDGMMVTYDLIVHAAGGSFELKGRKASRLGVTPLRVEAVHSRAEEAVEGDEKVLALGLSERMSVVFESKGRVDFSSVSKRVSPYFNVCVLAERRSAHVPMLIRAGCCRCYYYQLRGHPSPRACEPQRHHHQQSHLA